jgi:hypothetical protein
MEVGLERSKFFDELNPFRCIAGLGNQVQREVRLHDVHRRWQRVGHGVVRRLALTVARALKSSVLERVPAQHTEDEHGDERHTDEHTELGTNLPSLQHDVSLYLDAGRDDGAEL